MYVKGFAKHFPLQVDGKWKPLYQAVMWRIFGVQTLRSNVMCAYGKSCRPDFILENARENAESVKGLLGKLQVALHDPLVQLSQKRHNFLAS